MIALAAVLAGSRALATAPSYEQTNLVSDVPGLARFTDSHLIAAWGATHSATSAWWINSPLGGVAVVHDGTGLAVPTANPTVVSIPAPAGMTIPSIPTAVISNSGPNFTITRDHPAKFIFATRTGTVSAWNPQVNATNAVIVVPADDGDDYTGLAIAQRNGAENLYVANFGKSSVEVFDGEFKEVEMPEGAFQDPSIPAGFNIFNIRLINGQLYVTYAPKDIFDPTGGGQGQGFVSIFDVNGALLRRLNTGPWMNAPWGVVVAPDDFGHFGGRILVGMFGDGGIAAFDAEKGNFVGMLRGTEAAPLSLAKGLWALEFGNDAAAGPKNTLFFATDLVIGGNLHGLFGSLTPAR
jgi:uncharacterized protein (TIGR03118 family)